MKALKWFAFVVSLTSGQRVLNRIMFALTFKKDLNQKTKSNDMANKPKSRLNVYDKSFGKKLYAKFMAYSQTKGHLIVIQLI
jgi:hypothetical protein